MHYSYNLTEDILANVNPASYCTTEFANVIRFDIFWTLHRYEPKRVLHTALNYLALFYNVFLTAWYVYPSGTAWLWRGKEWREAHLKIQPEECCTFTTLIMLAIENDAGATFSNSRLFPLQNTSKSSAINIPPISTRLATLQCTFWACYWTVNHSKSYVIDPQHSNLNLINLVAGLRGMTLPT